MLCDHQSENNMTHLHDHHFLRDEDYVREIRAGGLRAETAIGCLYEQYRKRVYTVAHRLITKHPEFRGSPADLVHDSFILMVHKVQYSTKEVESLFGFWIGISRNLFLNQLKKDQRIILVRDPEEIYGIDDLSPEHAFLHQEERAQMEHTFSQLGARCREILLLWINRYSMLEIAAEMNLSTDAMARKIKFDCFKKLKDLVRTGNKIER